MLKTGYNGNDMSEKRPLEQHPLGRLDNEDLNMVLAFVLRSGSVKELAAHFGVSYPTMRARLDRLIERLEKAARGRRSDPMAELLADQVEQGHISLYAARRIRDLHRRLIKDKEAGK